MGQTGNSFSNQVVAFSQSLQTAGADAQTHSLSGASLQVFDFILDQMFGPAAQQALEHSVQVTKVKQQFSDLRQAPLPKPRHTSALRWSGGLPLIPAGLFP